MLTNASIVLLHLSDLQFGINHRFKVDISDPGMAPDTLLSRLCDDLEELHISEQKVPKPDVVVVTGDLAETGVKKEFDDVLTFLIGLTQRLGLGRDRVVIVPGNHDINWDLCEEYYDDCDASGSHPKKPY